MNSVRCGTSEYAVKLVTEWSQVTRGASVKEIRERNRHHGGLRLLDHRPARLAEDPALVGVVTEDRRESGADDEGRVVGDEPVQVQHVVGEAQEELGDQ